MSIESDYQEALKEISRLEAELELARGVLSNANSYATGLEAENARLRKALEKISALDDEIPHSDEVKIARAALKGDE